MTKNNSLIGLTEFLIPFQIIQNHETKFQKICNVTMTDNTKRTIFNSNNLSNNIKINVEANLNYENEKKDLKIHTKNSSSTNHFNKDTNNNNNNNNDNNEKEENNIKKRDVHTPTNSKLKKKLNNPKVQSPNVLSANSTNNTTKIIKNSSAKKIKNNNNNNNINKKPSNNINKTNSNKSTSNINKNNENNNNNNENNENNENNFQDSSQIDSILLKEPQKIDEKFTNFFKKLQENNPLEKLYSFQNDSKLFKNYTTKIIEAFFDYQKEYYSLLKQTLNLNSKLKNLLEKNNEKFRKIVKKKHRLDEMLEKNNLKQKNYVNVNKKEDEHLNEILPMKKNELNVYETIFSVNFNEKEIQNERKKKLNEENFKENEEKNFNLLKNVFLNVKENVNKNNNLNEDDFINKLNLEENEKNLINKIINENKNENEEKKEKIFYVISNKRDDNDDKLENFLKIFYSKRNVPKIFFKKLSNNNYEYGTEKIMVKFESDLIRVRYSGGYILLDKFLEVNGPIEEKKLKAKSNKKKQMNKKK